MLAQNLVGILAVNFWTCCSLYSVEIGTQASNTVVKSGKHNNSTCSYLWRYLHSYPQLECRMSQVITVIVDSPWNSIPHQYAWALCCLYVWASTRHPWISSKIYVGSVHCSFMSINNCLTSWLYATAPMSYTWLPNLVQLIGPFTNRKMYPPIGFLSQGF